MRKSRAYTVESRRQALRADEAGRLRWYEECRSETVDPHATAMVLCDFWDAHWCRSAAERVERMISKVSRVVEHARERGTRIIHAPSQTMDFYKGSAARERAMHARGRAVAAGEGNPPLELDHDDPPLPIDDTDGGCDRHENELAPGTPVWIRQHRGIRIEDSRDYITDDGLEVCAIVSGHGTAAGAAPECTHVFILGVHTNMCILNRSFGIKQMVRWGVNVLLVRDLTDAMYNPARSPYVAHEAGTELVIGYVERFWCPTAASTVFD